MQVPSGNGTHGNLVWNRKPFQLTWFFTGFQSGDQVSYSMGGGGYVYTSYGGRDARIALLRLGKKARGKVKTLGTFLFPPLVTECPSLANIGDGFFDSMQRSLHLHKAVDELFDSNVSTSITLAHRAQIYLCNLPLKCYACRLHLNNLCN